jgi:acyl-CoA reductase-like NAD-dependent aldehyde dehydrogenase
MYNTGQSCCSVERIYVHEKLYDPFMKEFLKQVDGFQMGSPEQSDTYIGAITREPQLTIIERQITDARAKGARIETGGGRKNGTGNFFEPTVVTGVNHSMEIMREESFGPVIGIQKVKDDTEAVRLMNDTEYGLTAGVYGKSEERARRLLAQVDSGTSYWNCCDRVSPRLPWTGRRHSGIGSTLSVEGIRAFTWPRAWHLKRPG